MHFLKLFILLAMGLGGMYMMHVLAQDFNAIRQPAEMAARALTGASAILGRGKRSIEPSVELARKRTNVTVPTVDWKRILSRDPFSCLPSLICQLMSGAENNTKEAILLMGFLETTLSVAPSKVAQAFSQGLSFRGAPHRCYEEYPLCIYSARTMLRVVRWLSA